MHIDWVAITPYSSLAGGLLIGLAASFFLLSNGRIAGISGIVGGLLRPVQRDIAWRVAFIGGLVLAPLLFLLIRPLPTVVVNADYLTLSIAGLLVGVGTRFGSGCTSGHGVCGLSRRSPRSLAATATFILAGVATVYLMRHLLAAGGAG